MLALLALLAQATGDGGVLIVRHDTVEVAREAFRLAPSLARTADTTWALATTIRWDRSRPIVTLAPVVELGADGRPRALEYDANDGRGARRILAQFSASRVTVREVSPGVERARELAAAGVILVVDDSVFALYLAAVRLAGPAPVRAVAVAPRTTRRDPVTITDRGEAETTVAGHTERLRLVVVSGAATGDVSVWTDAQGRLMKVEIPARRLTAERAPAG